MQANNKYIIECVEYSDIEYDENDIAQDVSRYQYWVYDAKTKKPLRWFNHDWEAINYCKENDREGSY